MQPGQISEHFERVIADAARLLAILRREHTLLTGRDPSAIGQIAYEKQQHLAQLEESSRQHSAALLAAGFQQHTLRMQDWLRQYAKDTGHDLTPAWRQLESLLTDCRHQNQLNGGIVETSRRHTQRALSLLLGKPQETELYNPDGATASSGISRTLARA